MPANYLVQDIETIPESEIAGDWKPTEENPFPSIQYHKVICIGMLILDENLHPLKSGCAADGLQGGKPEEEMIASWARIASGEATKTAPLSMVDWHGRAFDVPVMQTRALRYGINLPWYFGKLPDNSGKISSWSKDYRNRYGGAHLDVEDWWTNNGAFRKPHMADLARLIGLPGKTGIDGSKVYDAYKEGLYSDIDIYCMQDVYQTAFLFQRFQLMSGDIDLDLYRSAAKALLDEIAGACGQVEFCDLIDRENLLLL